MKGYYYKFDILCHEYIWGGIVDCDLEDYFSSKDEIYEWAEEYVVENWGEEQLDTLKEWGGIEIQINFQFVLTAAVISPFSYATDCSNG